MQWSAQQITDLRTWWADKSIGATEIGRRLGVSRNAVLGQAHRLDLPARKPGRNVQGARAVREAMLATRAATPPRPVQAPAPPPPRPVTVRPIEAPRPPVATVPAAALIAPPAAIHRRIISCCWPIGEPGTRTFRFCENGAVAGKPYCADHCARAYQKAERPSAATAARL